MLKMITLTCKTNIQSSVHWLARTFQNSWDVAYAIKILFPIRILVDSSLKNLMGTAKVLHDLSTAEQNCHYDIHER